MMNKKHADSQPSNLEFVQLNSNSVDLDTSTDVMAVDDLMKQYDDKEKKLKENEEFITVLKKDDHLSTFFLENYTPGSDNADDEKFISYVFSKYSEEGWSEDGKPLGKQVLSKKKARKVA